MKPTKQIILSTSIAATSAWVANRCITYTGALATAGDNVLGISPYEANAGDIAAVNLRGIAVVEAGAAIAVGQEVMTAAQGVIIPLTGTVKPIGNALDAATAVGDLIRVLLKG